MNLRTDIPQIFHPIDFNEPETDLLVSSNPSKWTEFIAHVSQFTESSIDDTQNLLNELMLQVDSDSNKAVLLTGIGRCQIHNGDLIKGAQTLGYALSHAKDTDRESQAFVMIEMASFLAITGQYNLAQILLDKVNHLSQNEYILRLANYYSLVVRNRMGDTDTVDSLIESVTYFQSIGEWATVAYHFKNLGNSERKSNNYKAASRYYSSALEIARSHFYEHIEAAILNDVGLLSYHTGDSDSAIQTFKTALEITDSVYTHCFILGSAGLVCKQSDQHSTAIQYLGQSFMMALQNNFLFLIPSLTSYLSDCHLKRNELAHSRYYLKAGYKAAMELMANHFPCNGYRKTVVDKYVTMLSKNQPESFIPDTLPDLSFVLDNSFKEIRSIFQGTVMDLISEKHSSVEQTIKELDIPRRTYFHIRNKSKVLQSDSSKAFIADFYSRHSQLGWKDLNKAFETEVCTYLLNHCNGSRKKLGDKLQISYPHAVKLTRDIPKKLSISSAPLIPLVTGKTL